MKKEKARRSKMLHFAVTEEEARIIDAKGSIPNSV